MKPSGGDGATRLLAPAPAVLAHRLALQRALRPLKRHVPSRSGWLLDEEETAYRIADQPAETRRWLAVLRPAPERWLDLAVVIDCGDTMAMWRGLAVELREALAESGLFRNLSVWRLNGVSVAPAARPSSMRSPRRAVPKWSVVVGDQ